MRVGFVITSPYQLFHFKRISQHLPSATAYIEVREQEFDVTSAFVEQQIPNADIVWVSSTHLKRIDGQCDVLVCHTPVPIMHFFSKSLVVAQQYSLAKEHYQYGVWRAQASLNLMYGPRSVTSVSGFANAVAVGNPLLDSVYAEGRSLDLPARASDPLRVLYMPTYGDLSDKQSVVRSLTDQGVALTVKLHHAETEWERPDEHAPTRIVRSDVDPIELIVEHDVVVSDYSGAIFDALAVRRPVLVVDGLNALSRDLHRLSDEDRSHSDIAGLIGKWSPGDAVSEAYDNAYRSISHATAFEAFRDRYFVNLGSAGRACAEEIGDLLKNGESAAFNVSQVRDANRRYILENRRLRAQLASIEDQGIVSQLRRIRAMPLKMIALKTIRWGLQRTPGGSIVLEAARAARSRLRAKVAPLEEQVEAEAVDRWSLPIRPFDRRRVLLRIVENALRKGGVDCRTHVTGYNAYCAVREAELDRVLNVINELGREYRPGNLSVWLGSGSHFGKAQPAEDLTLPVLANYESLVLGAQYTNQLYSVARRGGVELVIVEPRDVRLVAKRWQVEKADWTSEFGFSEGRAGAGRPRRGSSPLHVLEGAPIDVVYTWVDSSDPDWQASRSDWAARQHVELMSSSNDERYLDRDELRYSLRSVWLYAPFVRQIYIVTSGHQPKWLDSENPKITIVPHETIFPDAKDLPTFNSHAIEACLHRIPGLSEHFLYFNDDVFLGREASVETFFTRLGLMKSRFSPSAFTTASQPDLSAIPTDLASYNAVQLMLQDFGIFFDRKMKHVPMPLKRSLLEEIEQRYPECVTRTRSARFRSPTDFSIPSMLAHYYGVATGRAVEWEGKPREYAYADTGRKDFLNRLRAIKKDRPVFVCLNVTRHTDIALARQAPMLQEYLNEAYPVPSPYEKSDAQPVVDTDLVGDVALGSTGQS